MRKLLFISFLVFFFLEIHLNIVNCKRKRSRRQRNQTLLNNTLSAEKMDMIKKSWFTLLEENTKIANTKDKYERKMQMKTNKLKQYQIVETPSRQKETPPSKPGDTSYDIMSRSRTVLKASNNGNQEVSKKEAMMNARLPALSSAFIMELEKSLAIPKKTFAYLRKFTSSKSGTFIRGQGIDLSNGKFTAPYTGIYRFQATLHIARPLRSQSLKPNNAVTARICIEKECDDKLSLYYRSGISSNSKIFSMEVSGHLYLKKGEYVEVIVENTANNRVTVLAGSAFTGFLIGV